MKLSRLNWLALIAPANLFAVVGLSVAAQADAAAGAQKAEICLTCHGPEGLASMDNVPALGGQSDQYIQYQLVYFRNKKRDNELMQPQAAGLGDDDIRDLGAFLHTLPAPAAPDAGPLNAALYERGKALAQARHCAACHGDSYTGINAAPRVAWQREPYLALSLQNFRDAKRPSVGVAAMNEVTGGLTDDDTKALAHYLAKFAGEK